MYSVRTAVAIICVVLLAAPISRSTDAGATLDDVIPRLMEAADVPGLTAALIEDGKIVWTGAFGVRSAETGEPVDDETMFEAASMTKPVCAYVALRLVERGVGAPRA